VETLNFILSSVAVLGVAIIALLWKNYLPSYLKKKAEHLATKEDIGAITEQVKKVESKYSSELEKLRFDLERKNYVSNAQFELEFKTYQEIWSSSIDLSNAIRDIISFIESNDALKVNRIAAEMPITTGLMNNLVQRYHSFMKLTEQKRPFYPANIVEVLFALTNTLDVAIRQLQTTKNTKTHTELLSETQIVFKKFEDQSITLCDLIRARLTSLVAS
jgi:hypothetical protein